MTFNSKQMKIFIVSAAIFVVMGAFPPWIYTFDNRSIHSENPAGYALITEPPDPEEYKVQYGVRLDNSRLIVQWLVLLAATVGAVLLVGVERNRDKKG
jgi:hypothetical protein